MMSPSLHRRPCVVAIDASPDVRNLYREILQEEDYGIETFDCNEASRDALVACQPDVVLLDCFNGYNPSGWDILEVLSHDADLQTVPVVICTSDARLFGVDVRNQVDKSIRILSKPFDVRDLLGAIEASLKRQQSPSYRGGSFEVGRWL